MLSSRPPYHEKLLHWIWESRNFQQQQLTSSEGKEVAIHQTGRANKSDGPDFLNAEITVGKLRWYGDVEIHWKSGHWQVHGHQEDPGFQKVILHVAYQNSGRTIRRSDGSRVPTLVLGPYMEKPLQSFLEQYLQKTRLPCSGHFPFISEEAFSRQLERAHKEYFEQKINDILQYYDPVLLPSEAWLKMLTIALFDGLGISHNRRPMRRLAKQLFSTADRYSSAATLGAAALEISGIDSVDKNSPYGWKHRGTRPPNHPRPRIRQAAHCLWHLKTYPFKSWRRTAPKESWNQLINAVSPPPSIGRERANILFGTVFLPSLYLLGNLISCALLKAKSRALWESHRLSLPSSLLRPLEQTELSPSLYNRKLGTIYQLRNYCKARKCQDCKVFKRAISS